MCILLRRSRELARITGTDGLHGLHAAHNTWDGHEDDADSEDCYFASEVQRPLLLTATLSAQLTDAFDRGYIKNVRSLVALQDLVNAHVRLIQVRHILQCIQFICYTPPLCIGPCPTHPGCTLQYRTHSHLYL